VYYPIITSQEIPRIDYDCAHLTEMGSVIEQRTSKRQRKVNFTPEEQIALAKVVKEKIDILFGSLNSNVTTNTKTKVWMDVADAVNAIGKNNRSVYEIKTKLRNLQAAAANSAEGYNRRKNKKTGVGGALTDSSGARKIRIETVLDALVVGINRRIDWHEKAAGKQAHYSVAVE
jgi:hypothetical protein